MAKLEITTPEQVVFHYEAAGMVSRILAWCLDEFYIWVGYGLVIYAFANLGGTIGAIFIILGMFVLDFAYFTFFELYRAGQTPGKKLLSLRVISSRGTRIRFADSMIRNLLRPVDMLPLAMVLGGTVAYTDRLHRRLGDFAAETVVVKDAKRALPQLLTAQKARVNSFQNDRAIQSRILTRITRDERDLVLDLAVRRDQLDLSAREKLFAEACKHLRERFGLPEDLDHLSDEQTVLNVALIVQDAKFTG